MKKINLPSLVLGAIIALGGMMLISSASVEKEAMKFVPVASGVGIYNSETHDLNLFRIKINGDLNEEPYVTYKVAEDGSRFTEVE